MSLVTDILSEKCPKCRQGQTFTKKGNPLFFKMPKMNPNCPVCNHKFERETGYFFGSMYVSYALTFAEAIAFFLIVRLFIESYLTIVILIGVLLILMSTFNFRVSRMIWIYIFDGKK